MNNVLKSVATLGLWSFVACSPAVKPVDPNDSVPIPTPTQTATPTAEPTAEPTSEPTSVAPTSSLPPPSGRPPLAVSKLDKITDSFGATPAAKLELTKENVVFRVPEWALNDGVLLTFMLDAKAKKSKGAISSVYRLFAQQPPSESFLSVSSRGPAFTLRMPTKSATSNLAVGEASVDDKGKETITWRVLAPAKTEEGFVTFEFTAFTNLYLHLTTEAATAPAAAP